MLDTDTIANIIHEWAYDNPLLINAIANYFEAELGNECDAMGCDEEGHRGGHTWHFDRAKFMSTATKYP